MPMSDMDKRLLNERRQEISDSCSSYIRANAEQIIAYIFDRTQPNGHFMRLYQNIEKENKRVFSSPEQAIILQMANGYAAGVIERLEEGLYANSNNLDFIEFVKKHGRLPNTGELSEKSSYDSK